MENLGQVNLRWRRSAKIHLTQPRLTFLYLELLGGVPVKKKHPVHCVYHTWTSTLCGLKCVVKQCLHGNTRRRIRRYFEINSRSSSWPCPRRAHRQRLPLSFVNFFLKQSGPLHSFSFNYIHNLFIFNSSPCNLHL